MRKGKDVIEIILTAGILLVGAALLWSGIPKVLGERFTSFDATTSDINSPAHFFETLYRSGLFWRVIGVAQCASGILMLLHRFWVVGALLATPILINMFLITVSYNFGETHYITLLMLLVNTAALTWWTINCVRVTANELYLKLTHKAKYATVSKWTGFALIVTTIICRIQHDMALWFVMLALIMFIACLVMVISVLLNHQRPPR